MYGVLHGCACVFISYYNLWKHYKTITWNYEINHVKIACINWDAVWMNGSCGGVKVYDLYISHQINAKATERSKKYMHTHAHMNAYAHHATTSLIQLILWSQFRFLLSRLASYRLTHTLSLFHRIFISSRWPIRFRKSLPTTWHFLFDRTRGFLIILVFFVSFLWLVPSLSSFFSLCNAHIGRWVSFELYK